MAGRLRAALKIRKAGGHAGIVDLFSTFLQTLSLDRKSDLDTSLIFARAGSSAIHFVHEWINTHRHEQHQIMTQGNLTGYNQACLNRLSRLCSAAD